MLSFEKEKFEENLDDIMKSINGILEKTGDGFETVFSIQTLQSVECVDSPSTLDMIMNMDFWLKIMGVNKSWRSLWIKKLKVLVPW